MIIDWHDPAVLALLPDEMAISAISAAELAAGPHLATDAMEAAKRARPAAGSRINAGTDPVRRSHSTRLRTCSLPPSSAKERPPRSRFADLLIAATAHANHLDLYTRNGDDFTGLEKLVRVVPI